MGNRAVITTPKKKLSIYLHWNGGIDSVEAFLEYCNLKGFTCPSKDSYGWARLCQVIGNYFGGSYSVGIDRYSKGDEDIGENGLYVIQNWKITERINAYIHSREGYDRTEFLQDIDQAQPKEEQLGQDFFLSEEKPVNEINIGDEVLFFNSLKSVYERHSIVGKGDGRICNGIDTLDIPYVDRFKNGSPERNCNNYITTKTIRVIKKED